MTPLLLASALTLVLLLLLIGFVAGAAFMVRLIFFSGPARTGAQGEPATASRDSAHETSSPAPLLVAPTPRITAEHALRIRQATQRLKLEQLDGVLSVILGWRAPREIQ